MELVYIFEDLTSVAKKRATQDLLRAVLTTLLDSTIGKKFPYLLEEGEEQAKRISELAEIETWANTWEDGHYQLLRDGSTDLEWNATHALIVLDRQSIDLRIFLAEDVLSSDADTLIDQLISLTIELYDRLKGLAEMRSRMGVEVLGLPFERMKPPSAMSTWGEAFVVDVMVLNNERAPADDGDAKRWKLSNTKLPDHAEKMVHDELLIIKWVANLEDRKALADALAAREHWYSSTLDLPVESGYNELGDRMETPYDVEPHKPLTFYDSIEGIGYKAAIVTSEGTIDRSLVEELQTWIQQEELPDGSPVYELHLIVPDRESAVSILEEAQSVGVSSVLYLDDDRELWNPDPK